MVTLTIRNLDDALKARLRLEAAQHGHSMEEEVRSILRQALSKPAARGLGSRIHQRFAEVGGLDMELPERNAPPRKADLSGILWRWDWA